MTSPEGGFYAAEDADSEGSEGKFYVWQKSEFESVLGGELAELAARVYGVTESGNFVDPHGKGGERVAILNMRARLEDEADALGMQAVDLKAKLDKVREALFKARSERLRPFKDDKILTDWNGLMITAFARGSAVLADSDLADAADRAAAFILANSRAKDGGLLKRFRNGAAGGSGFADDYAFFVCGLLELYQSTFNVAHLEQAIELSEYLVDNFWDNQNGGLFFTHESAEVLLVRRKETYDGAIPSANSVAALNFLKLGRATGDAKWEELSSRIFQVLSADIGGAPWAFCQGLQALDFAVGPAYEVVISGQRGREDAETMLTALGRAFVPNKFMLFKDELRAEALKRVAPFTANIESTIAAKAYVCRDHACAQPTSDVKEMLENLRFTEG